jgi:gas vesicle protein
MSKSKNFVLGFILGSATAIATTYLLTPQTTSELKRKLREGKDQISDRAADYYEYAKDATGDLRSSAEEFVTGLKTKIEKPEPLDLDDYDAATAEVRAAVTDDDENFDDIVVDGKSAFAQAKAAGEAEAEAADDEEAEAPEAPADPEPATPAEDAEDTPED